MAGLYLTGGTAKGTRLLSVPGLDVRPALARMRISVFEILRPCLEAATAVDLFAGTGALGFEALSRGAAFCAFVERDARCVAVLRRNAEKLRFADRVAVVRGDALNAADLLAGLGRRFDLVFVDPPYDLYNRDGERLERAVARLASAGLLGAGAQIVVEHRAVQEPGKTWAGGRLHDRRRYGGTVVSWYTGPGTGSGA